MTDGADRPKAPASGDKPLEAPHRRKGNGPRVVERAAVTGYRTASWIIRTSPPGAARFVIGGFSQLSYLGWPTKRRWSNRNFGRVLGLPDDDPKVRRLALRAYGEYGRYLVEIMRLPARPFDEVAALIPDLDIDDLREIWHGSPGGGLILAVAHMGNTDAVAAAVARHDLPISVVADDSSFPELFEHLRRERERWGSTVVPWRNLRMIFGALRRREILGLLVDWGYRSDGIPVKFFGAWTTLPAGPATLAAKTGSRILPIAVRRQPDDTFLVTWPGFIELASSDPAELQRATQALAEALEQNIGAAPEQWYSFKPIWPSTVEEAADLERRALLMQAGQPDPGPGRGFEPPPLPAP